MEALRFDAFHVRVGPLVVRYYVDGGVSAFLEGFRVIESSGLLACRLLGVFVEVGGRFVRVSLFGGMRLYRGSVFFLSGLGLV